MGTTLLIMKTARQSCFARNSDGLIVTSHTLVLSTFWWLFSKSWAGSIWDHGIQPCFSTKARKRRRIHRQGNPVGIVWALLRNTDCRAHSTLLLISYPLLWQISKTLNLKREKVYFCSQFWRFHGQLTLLFWVCGEAAYHGRRAYQRRTAHLIARMQKRGRRSWGPQPPSRAHPKDWKTSL
jgi:hypothetical protein